MARPALVAVLAAVFAAHAAHAQYISFAADFDVNQTAAWTVAYNGTEASPANFYFDYASVGIPQAPNSRGSATRGLKLQANLAANILSGVSASPIGRSFLGDYEVRFDWWENFNGPAPIGGNGSTQLATFGVGTTGTVAHRGGTTDAIWFAATGDGNSSSDWRAYSPVAPSRYLDAAPGIYAAGEDPASTNGLHPYYAEFGGIMAPEAQTFWYPQQAGTTAQGSPAFQWHEVQIQKLGASVFWRVDGRLIATVPVADDTVPGGANIFFGHADTTASSSNDPNDVDLLFTLIDNIVVIGGGPDPDFNDDDSVDGKDFLAWQQSFGRADDLLANHLGDADLDHDVDARDLEYWRYNFGHTPPATQQVPEPTGALTLLIESIIVIPLTQSARRQRSRRPRRQTDY